MTPGVRSSGRWPRPSPARVRWIRPRAGASCRRRSTSPLRAARWKTARDAVEELESIAAGYQATALRGRCPDGEGRAAARRGPAFGGVPDPGSLVAAVAGTRPALRERASSTSVRRGDRRGRRQGDGPEGPPGGSHRVRAPGRDARPAAGRRAARGRARRPRPQRGESLRTFMFTDIVTSTDLVGLDGRRGLGENSCRGITGSFDRPSQAIAARKSTAPATASSWRSSEAADAIECAVDIQRRLTRHRREHGFAPVGADRSAFGRGDAGWP